MYEFKSELPAISMFLTSLCLDIFPSEMRYVLSNCERSLQTRWELEEMEVGRERGMRAYSTGRVKRGKFSRLKFVRRFARSFQDSFS